MKITQISVQSHTPYPTHIKGVKTQCLGAFEGEILGSERALMGWRPHPIQNLPFNSSQTLRFDPFLYVQDVMCGFVLIFRWLLHQSNDILLLFTLYRCNFRSFYLYSFDLGVILSIVTWKQRYFAILRYIWVMFYPFYWYLCDFDVILFIFTSKPRYFVTFYVISE